MKTRILIVDDELSVRMVLQRALVKLGWHVETADSAEEGFSRFVKKPFDVMIVDKNLPKMNGIELIGKIREQSPGVRFFLITAQPSVESALDALEFSIDGYFTKPFDLFEVMNKVREVVAKLEKRQESAKEAAGRSVAESLSGTQDAGEYFRKAAERMKSIRDRSSKSRDLKILVASPYQNDVRWIVEQLDGQRDEITTLTSSREVLNQAKLLPPDILIVDAGFSDPDIFELLRKLQEISDSINCAVAIENPSVFDVTRLIELAVSVVLEKPLDRLQFRDKVSRLIQRSRLKSGARPEDA